MRCTYDFVMLLFLLFFILLYYFSSESFKNWVRKTTLVQVFAWHIPKAICSYGFNMQSPS